MSEFRTFPYSIKPSTLENEYSKHWYKRFLIIRCYYQTSVFYIHIDTELNLCSSFEDSIEKVISSKGINSFDHPIHYYIEDLKIDSYEIILESDIPINQTTYPILFN